MRVSFKAYVFGVFELGMSKKFVPVGIRG